MAESRRALPLPHPGPWSPLYLLALVPALAFEAGLAPCLAWACACAVGSEQLLARSPTRHVAGTLLALAGGVVILFFLGNEQRLATGLLVLPSLAFLRWKPAVDAQGLALRCLVPFLLFIGYCLAFTALYLPLQRVAQLPAINDDFLFSLRAAPVPEPLTEAERLAAVDVVRSTLRGESVERGSLPARLLEEQDGRTWVTFFRRGPKGRVVRGMAAPGVLVDQLVEATSQLRKSNGGSLKAKSKLPLQIDLGGPEQDLRPTLTRRMMAEALGLVLPRRIRWDPVVYDHEPGVDGLILQSEQGEGVLLPGDVIIRGWKGITPRSLKRRWRLDNFEVVWPRLARRAGLEDIEPYSEGGARDLLRFRTYSFAQPRPVERRTVELYRQNVLIPPLEEQDLIERLRLAGTWLLSTVEEDGRFDYEYFPSRDRHGRGYNEVRHAGSVYGLFHMYHLARSEPALRDGAEAYLQAGLLALDRVYGKLGTPPGADPAEGLVTFLQETKKPQKTNSGAPSLTLLSFLERPLPEQVDDPALAAAVLREGDDAVMRGLAGTLVAMIDEKGAVYQYWHEALAGGGVVKEPYYYPGEAMLALALYHQRTGEAKWLEAAQAIGRRQVRLAGQLGALPDHWVMQALDVLDEVEPENPLWREGAYSMADRYVSEQFPPLEPPFPDYLGSFRRQQEVPRTTRAAARGEAVGAVARIAWRHSDPSGRWERSVIEGARHLSEQMWTADNSFFLADPAEARGAIRMGIIDTHCRIDNNQHAIVALGNALASLRRQAAPASSPDESSP